MQLNKEQYDGIELLRIHLIQTKPTNLESVLDIIDAILISGKI